MVVIDFSTPYAATTEESSHGGVLWTIDKHILRQSRSPKPRARSKLPKIGSQTTKLATAGRPFIRASSLEYLEIRKDVQSYSGCEILRKISSKCFLVR